MEHLHHLLLFFPLTLLILILILMLTKKKPPYSSIPGPSRLPIIGSLHHLLGPTLPHRRLALLSKLHGPVMLLKLGRAHHVVISSPSAAEHVLKTHDLAFASRPHLSASRTLTYNYTNIIHSHYGPYWRQIRKICVMELLTVKRVRSFGYVRREEVANLVSDVQSSTENVDLSGKLMALANNITFKAVIGKKCREQERFIRVIKKGSELISGFRVADLFPELWFVEYVNGLRLTVKRVHEELDGLLEEMIRDHEMAGDSDKNLASAEEEDLLSVLLRFKDNKDLEFPLTNNNIKAVIMDLFVAGTTSSSSAIEWAMSELIRKPEKMKRAQAEVRQVLNAKGRTIVEESDIYEMNFLQLIIKETFRLHPPTPVISRVCKKSCSIQGYKIPEGYRILINIWALGRDPQCWVDADTFKPERFDGSLIDFRGADFEYIPFGAGRRICPGISFGLVNVELTLAQILYSFDWKLPNGMKPDELDMTETSGLSTSRKLKLYLNAIPYI